MANRNHLAVASPDLLDITDHLGVDRIAGGNADHGHLLIDQGDRAMLHLAGGVAFGVDVADLLELEGPLQGDGIVDLPPQEEGITDAMVALGQIATARCCLLDQRGAGRDSFAL